MHSLLMCWGATLHWLTTTLYLHKQVLGTDHTEQGRFAQFPSFQPGLSDMRLVTVPQLIW